jgi:decaprenyl-phosphate phosphoribosyltransferase
MSKFLTYINLLRPHQWLKNLLILFPPFFAGTLFERSALGDVFFSLAAFSLIASSGYIINDIIDRDADKNHAKKRNRGIPKGVVSTRFAVILSVVLCVLGLYLSTFVSSRLWIYGAIYFVVSFLYTLSLKHIVILDIFAIAFAFLIRVLAGGEAFNVRVTNWLFLTVFLVALFLATGKRVGELISLGAEADKHRKIFSHYSRTFLEGLLWSSASAALVAYALYTIDNTNKMFYTVPIAAFGLFRYIFIVQQGKGDPTEALLGDWQIMSTGIIWATMIGLIIYK